MLQASTSMSSPMHPSIPTMPLMQVLSRDLVPPPHDSEQAPHGCHGAKYGHGSSLQGMLTCSGPWQPIMPWIPLMQRRDLVVTPPPQDTVQADPSLYSDQNGQS